MKPNMDGLASVVVLFAQVCLHRASDLKSLVNQTVGDYGPKIRPELAGGERPEVIMDFLPVKIIHIDPSAQELAVAAIVYLHWPDPRLAWKYEDYPNWSIEVDVNQIWTPKIGHRSSSNANYDLIGTTKMHTGAMLASGHVQFQVANTFISTCNFDVTMFPFDRQTCVQTFTAWPTGGPFKLNVSSDNSEILSEIRAKWYEKHSEWDLLLETHIEEMGLPPHTPTLRDVIVTFHLTRKYTYYIYSIVIPLMGMSILITMIFMIPPDAGEKLSFSVTILLTFFIFQLSVDASIPKTSDSTPLISIVILILQLLAGVSISMTIFVLNLHHTSVLRGRVPCWFRCVLKYLGKLPSVPGHVTKIFVEQKSVVSRNSVVDVESPGKKEEEGEEEEDFAVEWRGAAVIVDRVLMTVCAIVVTATMMTLIIRLAMNHKA